MSLQAVETQHDVKILGCRIGTAVGIDKIDDDLTFIYYMFKPDPLLFPNEKFEGILDFTVDFVTGQFWLEDDRTKILKEGHIVDLVLNMM
jgi:hypothetical protein